MRIGQEGQSGLDEAWIERWRADVRTGIGELLSIFEPRFGFPPGEHEVSGPATAAELAGLADLHGGDLPADLLLFHQVVAEVRLPDINNGYWIHRPPLPGEDPDHPRRLSDGRTVIVFGSGGGGALFAMSAGKDAPVLRLSGGALTGETYDADGATAVAANLQDFLAFLRREVTEFVGSAKCSR
ncbi:hypothetical protein [Actinoplanes solisilvae]|uniref:hypothetical protein n=1 Tax=Actinoplanes solisilvae TaxID=2486853 RepID=UPI000FD75CF8|nr:hypothetical protein [Actinoplanes solisilvae]